MSDDRIAPEANEPQAEPVQPAPEMPAAPAVTATESGDAIASPTGPTPEAAVPSAVVEQIPTPEPAPTQIESPPVAATPAPTPTPSIGLDDTAEFEAALDAFEGAQTGTVYDDAYRRLKRNEMLTARVIQVDDDKVFVDLGTKSEGVIELNELSSTPFEKPSDIVKVGDEITVVVIQPDARDGNPKVSRKRAEFEATWDRIVKEFENKETITALVTERVKGGLVVDLGVRGFVPATHVANGTLRNLDKFVGQSLPLKILEVDRDKRKVVLSNRLAEEETREERKKKVFETVKPGDIMEGHVRRLVDYGAFIDLGGVDGLLHVSEMSWSRVDHPREVLKEGDEVKVMVLRLDPQAGRISLGRRQVLPDPWTTIRETYNVGQRLTVPVSRVVQSGAFVKLPEGAEAFLPTSEMAHRRISKPQEVVNPGDQVEVQVIDLRPDERRMVLSIRALLPNEERQQHHHHSQREDTKHRSERSRSHRGGGEQRQQSAPAGSMTIGERLGALRGLSGALGTEEQTEPSAEQTEETSSEAVSETTETDVETAENA